MCSRCARRACRHFDLKTTLHRDLFALFDHVITGDMVRNGKPDPEIFHVAAGTFDPAPAPDHCLVFEDAPSGPSIRPSHAMPVGRWIDAHRRTPQD